MKKKLLFIAFSLLAIVAKAQNPGMSDLTIDNEKSDLFTMKVLSCVGNTSSQTVLVTFAIEQSKTNQYVHMHEHVVLDEEGNQYEYERPKDGRGGFDGVYAPTGQLRKCKTIITGILPRVKNISYLEYEVRMETTKEKFKVILKNLPIEWR